MLAEGNGPKLTDDLSVMNSVVDAIKLQIYEESDLNKALFGHSLTTEQLLKISELGDLCMAIKTSSRTLTTKGMAEMIAEIENEFETAGRRFTFFCGHDSTIASLVTALDISDYRLPGTISQKTPIGGKLVFEKYRGTDGQAYIRLWYVYASTDQLRRNATLSLTDAPMFYEMAFDGLGKNADGYYRYEDVMARFDDAIRIGDEYRAEDAETAA